jgi:hypothetical protein
MNAEQWAMSDERSAMSAYDPALIAHASLLATRSMDYD